MFEKVNPAHPDKLADRIAGAIVDYCYTQEENPRVAVEVLLGHGSCRIIAESSVDVPIPVAHSILDRIAGPGHILHLKCVPQDPHLAGNQEGAIRCGDNGIFKGMPTTGEQRLLSVIAREIYRDYPSDGKYIIDRDAARLVICQSNAPSEELREKFPTAQVNPLGDWTGGPGVDCGATNRKLGSDMGDGVTGGGLHGKDLSKADVSVNIYAYLEAQRTGKPQAFSCAIGDTEVNGVPFASIVETARQYIKNCGGFEKFAEWGLI